MRPRKFAVIGLGRFGVKLAQLLSEKGMEVMAIDIDQSALEKVKDIAAESVQLNGTNEEILKKAGIKDIDVAVVGMGRNVEASILTTALLKELGVREIIARATSSLHARILYQSGASRVVFPEEDMAVKLARSILFPRVRDYLELIGPWDISEIEIGPESKFTGKTLKEIGARFKYGVNILMIEKEKKRDKAKEEPGTKPEMEKVRIFPTENYRLEEEDILVVFGDAKNLESFQRACTE